MSGGVSVVICCHNSAKRLPETLRHLAAQQVADDIPWEVVVIDNASTDDTATTALRCWPASHPASFRVVSEPRRGVGNARFRSFSEARHEFISFIDDDNWVGPAWISTVAAFFRDHPEAAAVGGPSEAVFETAPPAWFAGVSSYYAIGNQHAFAGDITDRPGTLLWTAGLSLRRGRVLDLIEKKFRFFLCGGEDFAIQTSEDTELCFALRAGGGRLYYEPKLAIRHFMPADRLTWPKALKLMHTMGEASPLIDLYLIALNRFPFDTLPAWRKTWLFRTLKVIRQLGGILASHPRACFLRPEGSPQALSLEKSLGQLATLWLLRGRYKEIRESIKNAAWARGAGS